MPAVSRAGREFECLMRRVEGTASRDPGFQAHHGRFGAASETMGASKDKSWAGCLFSQGDSRPTLS